MQPFILPYTALTTLVALVLYFAILYNVGRARARYKVPPPSTDGPEEFLRALRVQVNMTDNLVLFLPLLWLAGILVHDHYAAFTGGVWICGRLLYAFGYYKAAEKRRIGFFINMLTTLFLFGGVGYGVVHLLVTQ